jgi:VIT1/CCC1 family predicted Fe2+/Mn2+ transporter
MKKPFFVNSAKAGYIVASLFFLVACSLFLAGWDFLPSSAAVVAVMLAIFTAITHGHLSKKKNNQAEPLK